MTEKLSKMLENVKEIEIVSIANGAGSFGEEDKTSGSSYLESSSSNGLSFCMSCEDSRNKNAI